MKATVRDIETLRSVRPLEFATYLRANGWEEYEHLPERASVWSLDDGSNGGYEILLPLRRDFGDFVNRISEALQTLEIVEQRSQLEILEELATTAADVVRVRVNPADSENGSIAIDRGVELFQRAREMMLAAACAAVEPRNQYQTRKPNKAVEYLSKVHIGQTERGSYAVNIISRVAPTLESETLFSAEPYQETDPFARVVTRTLVKALEATRTAAEYSAATGTVEYFNQAIVSGVSANLCEAIVGMSESGGGQGLEIDLRWAPARPMQRNIPRNVSFSADAMPLIEEAGRLFRETPPKEGFEVEGYVIRLAKVEERNKRIVTIASFIEDNPRKVSVELSEADHKLAIQAYKEGIRVVCYGNLVKRGNTFILLNPHGFSLDPD